MRAPLRVVVATRNRGKLRELVPLFAELQLGFELATIDELAPAPDLHEALRGVPPERRGARYRRVAAVCYPARGLEVARAGACEGRLLEAARGAGGFGYDPYFVLPEGGVLPGGGRTMAEIPLEEKN